ncbi:MAG TPA: class I SAM-dependent methyltransferase [Pseudonocardiaceae bacterium]|jgi:ubiquinone/menaquinone biosynthesis C-methylase UbiE
MVASDSSGSTELDPRIVHAQQAYNPRRLAVYDAVVLNVFCRLAWRCPPGAMMRLYNEHVGNRHLDIGPGTGYFVDRCRFPTERPELTLLDLSAECLDMSAKRLARFSPATCQANLLDPLPLPRAHFDSAAMNLVFHTIPGGWEGKGKIFKHVAETLRPGGVLFGTTVLAEGVPMNAVTRRALQEQYRRGNFQNQGDSPEGLREQLSRYFPSSQVSVRGIVGVFVATAG